MFGRGLSGRFMFFKPTFLPAIVPRRPLHFWFRLHFCHTVIIMLLCWNTSSNRVCANSVRLSCYFAIPWCSCRSTIFLHGRLHSVNSNNAVASTSRHLLRSNATSVLIISILWEVQMLVFRQTSILRIFKVKNS